MDPLTQGLLGAATAQLGFRQRLGGATTLIAALTAMLADLDVVVGPVMRLLGAEVDGFTLMRTHRALSHSLLAVPGIALVTALPWWRRRRRKARQAAAAQAPHPAIDSATHPEVAAEITADIGRTEATPKPPFLLFYACTLVAAASHPLLDFCTSYGTQLLAPFTTARLALDAVPIIDIIYTPILIITLLACWLARKFSAAGAPRVTIAIGWLGMLLGVGYIAAGYALGRLAEERAVELAVADGARRHEIREANAYPYLGTIFLWRTTVRTDDKWYVTRLRPLRAEPPAPDDRQQASIGKHLLIASARELPQVKTYEWFAGAQLRGEYRRVGDRHFVLFHDMRYGRTISSVESMWPTEVQLDWQGTVKGVRRLHHYRDGRRSELFRRVWEEIHR